MHRILAICSLLVAPLVGTGAPTARIVNTSASPAPDGQRFLFLVDMSSGMERLQPEVEATVYELIGSGLGGYMRAGDTYGMWTFNRRAYAGRFPMQVWDPKKAAPLGTIAAAFLSEQTYERSSSLKPVMESVGPIIRAVSNLTVLIISDGSAPMRGTPFDDAINAEYRKQNRERKDMKRPFVTTLIVRDGWFVGNSVRISGQSIAMPERPLPAVAAIKTNLPPVAKAPPTKGKVVEHTAFVESVPNPKATATSAVASVATAAAPKDQVPAAAGPTDPVKKADPVAASLASASPAGTVESPKPKFIQITTVQSSPPTNAPVVSPAVTAAAAPAPVQDNATGTNALVTASPPAAQQRPAEQSPAVSHESSAVQSASIAPDSSRAFAAIDSLPIPVAARELNSQPESSPPAVPALQAVTTPVQSGLGAGLMLAFGGVLLAAALFLLLVTARRFRPVSQGSIITQSMDTRTLERR